MSNRRRLLPVFSDNRHSAIPITFQEIANEELWRWNPDAKLVRKSAEGVVLVNFLNRETLIFENYFSRKLAFLSGLTLPFRFTDEIPSAIQSQLIDGGFVIRLDNFSNHQNQVQEYLHTLLNDSYGLIIMPTEKCNFRCKYCYESFAKGRMSEHNIDLLSNVIEEYSSTVENFSLGFFGGEPLLCADLVIKFSTIAKQNLISRGLFYSAGIATNGSLLTSELFDRLLDAGVQFYQITIDGNEEMHNSQRPSASGQPTFRKIVKNLRTMAESNRDFLCLIRCNSDSRNFSKLYDLFDGTTVDFIKNDSRFKIDVHQIWQSDRNDVNAHKSTAGCSSTMSQIMDFQMLSNGLNLLGYNSVAFADVPSPMSSACYAGKPNWFVVGSDLSLYKCTVVFDREENKVGEINETGFVVDRLKNLLWTGSNAITDAGCNSCHLRVPCGGISCPLTRFAEGTKVCPSLKNPENLNKWANAL